MTGICKETLADKLLYTAIYKELDTIKDMLLEESYPDVVHIRNSIILKILESVREYVKDVDSEAFFEKVIDAVLDDVGISTIALYESSEKMKQDAFQVATYLDETEKERDRVSDELKRMDVSSWNESLLKMLVKLRLLEMKVKWNNHGLGKTSGVLKRVPLE